MGKGKEMNTYISADIKTSSIDVNSPKTYKHIISNELSYFKLINMIISNFKISHTEFACSNWVIIADKLNWRKTPKSHFENTIWQKLIILFMWYQWAMCSELMYLTMKISEHTCFQCRFDFQNPMFKTSRAVFDNFVLSQHFCGVNGGQLRV